ncbi:hypothetical protein Taro_027951 [Colocasia esculenta]|uniref:Uncharacterized protein n=1 Tax=Colocasia esculenta TaxID=4460 RepID=A0A843VJK4_COLES|nr:hypothetical protein [Colocasia esculenta]
MAEAEEAAAAKTLAEEEVDARTSAVPVDNVEVDEGGLQVVAEPSAAVELEETLDAEGGGEGEVVRGSGGSPGEGAAGGSPAAGAEAGEGSGGSAASGEEAAEGSGPDDQLARADELFEKGSKAIEDGDFVEAVDCLSRALEIRAAHYGELAPECVSSYYKYGCALLYKAQEEADPLGNVPKDSSRNSGTSATVAGGESSASSRISVGNDKQDHSLGNNEEEGEGVSKKDQEDDEGSDDGGEELGEGDEDDSDLDLAWKMLDIARAIVEKCSEDSIEKVNILAALGEVAVEREDIETSLGDYQKALSILENLVEPNHRRIIELYPNIFCCSENDTVCLTFIPNLRNFRICLVLELGSKHEEAIPYCKKAITLCESRLQMLKESVMDLKSEVTTGDAASLSTSDGTDHSSSISEKEREIELIGGIFSELEKKLEDLQQLMLNPKSLLAEMLKMVASKSSAPEKCTSLSSSQMTVMNGASDSPTISTAGTDSGVTHLGVVGRGVKRASITPIPAEPSTKKPFLEPSADKADTDSSEVLGTKAEES